MWVERRDDIDDPWPVGQSCTVGLGMCMRSGSLMCNAGGTNVAWGSNWTAKGAPEAEIRSLLEGFYSSLLDGIAKAG